MPKPKLIFKIYMEVFCFEEEKEEVMGSLQDWYYDCEANLFGNPPAITSPTEQEELAARPVLEDSDC